MSAALALALLLADSVPPPDLTELSLAELAQVKVTSVSKEPVERARTPAAITVITAEDIRRSGATTLAEVLRLAPGVAVARIDGSHWSVGVRGFGDQFSKSVLVLIDGRNVYTPLFAGVFWDVQDTVLADIDHIEVIRGPGGRVWGANAVNGVINIITKKARDTRGTLATLTAGNVDHGIGDVRYGAGHGPLDYRIYGKAFDRGPQFHSDGRDFDGSRRGQGGGRLDWSMGGRDTLTVQADAYGGRLGQSVSLASFSPPSQSLDDDPLHVSGGNVLARWQRDLGPGADLQVQAYYDRTRLSGPQLLETRNTFDLDFIHHRPLPGGQDFIWGLGARSSPSTFVPTVDTLDFVPRQKTNTIFTAFAQDELSLFGDRLSLSLGSKLEHNDDTGWELQPSARLRASLGAHHAVWAAVTRAVRTPSRIERDFRLNAFLAAQPLTYLEVDGNPRFDSEKLVGYEAGYRGLLAPKVYVDVAAFHNDYDDLAAFGTGFVSVDARPVPHATLHVPFANGIAGSTDGVEVTAEWKPAAVWSLQGWYSYLDMSLHNQPGNTDTSGVATAVGSSPRHQVALRSRFTLARRVECDQAFRYVSALPARAVEGYVTLDLRLGVPLPRGFHVSVVGQNLLQPHHAEFGHDPPPTVEIRRAGYLQLAWAR